jgi:hypothetical protein
MATTTWNLYNYHPPGYYSEEKARIDLLEMLHWFMINEDHSFSTPVFIGFQAPTPNCENDSVLTEGEMGLAFCGILTELEAKVLGGLFHAVHNHDFWFRCCLEDRLLMDGMELNKLYDVPPGARIALYIKYNIFEHYTPSPILHQSLPFEMQHLLRISDLIGEVEKSLI